MKKNKLFNVLFREKPVELLISLLNAKTDIYASVIAKEIDCTYSHVVKLLKTLEKAGIVKFNKSGRLKYLALTPKGKKLSENLNSSKEIILTD
ncbi:MAG TPA: MarR family transcriptional regulator [Candidatus Woesearchaeota archaeon]|nr:MarR family transcriptional regulator [Candidatus Woesearchaeota archaeon]